MVRHNGTKLWLYRYRFGGKRKNMSFGTFPGVGLRAARDKCCATEKLLDQGQDPVAVREAKRNDDEKPARLRDVGVDRAAFGSIAAKAAVDPLTRNNPRTVSPADIENVLELAW